LGFPISPLPKKQNPQKKTSAEKQEMKQSAEDAKLAMERQYQENCVNAAKLRLGVSQRHAKKVAEEEAMIVEKNALCKEVYDERGRPMAAMRGVRRLIDIRFLWSIINTTRKLKVAVSE
jgi:hypothetical protein